MSSNLPEASPPPRGYTQLAKFMVDHEHVMLKQYKELAIRDLLYLQAELCDLQYDYAQQAKMDSQEQDQRRLYDREWWHLQSDKSRGGDGKQWQLALQIRAKLREYYAAIKQYQEIAFIQRPSEHQRKIVHSFIHSESLGGNCQFLGRDLSDEPPFPSVFSRSHKPDLLLLGEDRGEDDLLSRTLRGPGMKMFHRILNWVVRKKGRKRPDLESGQRNNKLRHYSDKKLRFALDVFGSAISSIIPSVAIIVLFFVHDLLKRLALVCVFSFIFSICMSLATRGRRIEIFGATAAFASVQVVFVGTTSG